jgi:hypothetical protein
MAGCDSRVYGDGLMKRDEGRPAQGLAGVDLALRLRNG